MAELFKFRCPDCGKLLGAPARKVGKVVRCPRCRVELVVPSLDDADTEERAGEDDEVVDFEALGIDLGLAPSPVVRPAEPTERPHEAAEAISFLEHAGRGAPALAPAAAAVGRPPARTVDSPSEPGLAVESDAGPEPDADQAVSSPVEPLIPAAPRRRRRRQAEPAIPRRRDVVLPRTAAIAWAMFAILALGVSFVAGLMIGHYRWR